MPFYKDRIFQWIFAILALLKAGALAYLYFCHPLGEAVLIFPDSLTYVYPAQTWLQYGAFWEAVSSTPMLLRTPGYPVFLAGIQWALGNATWAVVAVQNLLSLFMLVPVYLTAKELAGKTAARWAAGFCAASVLYFSLSFAVLTETLCTFLLAWFVYFLVRFLKKFQTGSLLWASALLAAAIYVRPAAYYFAFAAGVVYELFSIAGRRRRIYARILREARAVFLDAGNCAEIFAGADVVMDALDNNGARQCALDCCRAMGIPFVHGAVSGFCGETAVLRAGDVAPWELCGASDRGAETEEGTAPFIPPFIAAAQAAAAIKILARAGETPEKTMLWFDLERCAMQRLKLK